MFLKKGKQVKPSTHVFDSLFFCLPRDFVQKAKSRGKKTKEIPRRRLKLARIERYLQLKYTVSAPEKISICLIRDRMESSGNDDVSIDHARK